MTLNKIARLGNHRSRFTGEVLIGVTQQTKTFMNQRDAGGKKRIFSVNSKMPTVVSRYDAGNPRNVGVGAPNGGGVSDNGGEVMRYDAENPRNVGVAAPNDGVVTGNDGGFVRNESGVSPNGGGVSRYAAGVGRQLLPGNERVDSHNRPSFAPGPSLKSCRSPEQWCLRACI